MTLTVTRALNGWVLTSGDEQDPVIEVIGEGDDAAVGTADLLNAIIEHFDLWGDRYAARRVAVVIRPGDKHHDLHPHKCAECACACDPDRSTE